MTLEETTEILGLLQAAYPHFYAKKSDEELDAVMDLWASLFEQDDVRLVGAAVRSYIDSDEKGFPPVPGQIRAKIRLIVGQNELSEAEAWGRVMDILHPPDDNAIFEALAQGMDYMEECFYRLPPAVQRVVHSPEQLYTWHRINRETLASVIASNFMRSYREIAAREREYDKLPPDVKALVSGMRTGWKSLPDGDRNTFRLTAE